MKLKFLGNDNDFLIGLVEYNKTDHNQLNIFGINAGNIDLIF